MAKMRKVLIVASFLVIGFNLISAQDDTSPRKPPTYNDTLCGALSNDTKNIPYLFNLDPSIEDLVPERGYSTDVEVNFYSTVTGEGKTFHASEVHNFILVKDESSPSYQPQLLSSKVDLRYPSENKDRELIFNFRKEDETNLMHSETFVLSWNKRPSEAEKEFQPCQTYTDKAKDKTGGNNLPIDLWPNDDFIPRPMASVVSDSSDYPYDWFVGPSAVLEQARILAERELIKYNGRQMLDEPAIEADVWTYCDTDNPAGSFVVKYLFTTGEDETGPDGEKRPTLPRPIKVVSVRNGGEEIQTMTFHNFQLLKKFEPIYVPLRMGCTRLALGDPSDPATAPDGSPAPKLPEDFFTTDFEMELEIVTRSGDDKFTSSSGSNAKFYHLSNFNMTSITQTEMDISKGDENTSLSVDSVRFKQRSVVDLNDLFLYQTKLSTSECKIKQPMDVFNVTSAWDMVPPVTFLMGSQLKLFRRDLWTVSSPLTFMGKRTERGIPVVVYEKDFENIFTDELGQPQVATVTQFFVNTEKGVRYENPFIVTDAPLKIIVTIWDGAKETINREITVNVYKFKSGLIDEQTKVREFGITDCFDESYQSNWFQVLFAAESLTLIKEAVEGRSDEIENAFRQSMDVAPNRLPVVDVDYNDAGVITISAQLLDRPEWYYLFSMPTSGQIKDGALTESTMLETPGACAKACLSREECTDFSYCNNLECDLFLGGNTHGARLEVVGTRGGPDGNEMNDCLVYSKSAAANKEINDKIFDQLEVNINRKNFKISIDFLDDSGKRYDKDLTAIELRLNVAPGFGDWEGVLPKAGGGDDVNHWINDYEINFKGKKYVYDKNDQDGNAIVLGKGISSCADLCNEDERCNSFSFCNGKDQLECIVNKRHGSEITDDVTKVDTKCNIISKNFLSDYEKHPNLRVIESAAYSALVSSDVECAKLCSTNKTLDCKSFDFCENTAEESEAGSFVCLTHKYHLAMTSETDRDTQQIKLDLNTTICEHFTKKYTKDYTVARERKLNKEVPVLESMEGETLEFCASVCSDPSISCSTFEYCEVISPDSPTDEVTTNSRSKPTRTCKLVSEKLTKVKEVSVSNENCGVYTITKTAERRSKRTAKNSTGDASGGVSPVAVGLVSVLFLILGAVGGVYAYKWYQNRTFV